MFKRNPLPRPSVPLPILPQFSLRRRCGAQTARAAAVAAVVVSAAAVAAAAPSSSKQTARGAGRRGGRGLALDVAEPLGQAQLLVARGGERLLARREVAEVE